jgi:hypothetical protein
MCGSIEWPSTRRSADTASGPLIEVQPQAPEAPKRQMSLLERSEGTAC